jgi:tetratricopeptide (TPR) repeat protein
VSISTTYKTFILAVLFHLFSWNESLYAQQEDFDSLFLRHAGNLIYENYFDSAEILLRNKLSENIISDKMFFNCHLQLAKMYMKLNDKINWQKEINFCRSILSQKNRDLFNQDLSLELSQDYFTLQLYDSAYHYSNIYLSNTTLPRSDKYANAKIIIGYCLFLKGDYTAAEQNYNDAVSFYPTINSNCELPLVYTKLSLLKMKQHQLEDASNYINLAIKISDSCNNKLYKKISLLALNDLNIQLGDYKLAYETLQKSTRLVRKSIKKYKDKS